MTEDNDSELTPPSGVPGGKYGRAALNALGGVVPLVGGIFSAAAGMWSEAEQEKLNSFFKHWLEMLRAEAAEKQRTIIEVAQRLDLHDEAIADRISSDEYQSILRKGFRDWPGAESEEKRILMRNILANAGATRIVSDDVVKLFMDWVKTYSEFHFQVVAKIYNHAGITRAGVWEALGRAPVREDSADADLFKLLFHDLSTGRVIRQHRETDYAGNFITKSPPPRRNAPRPMSGPRQMKSAFDDTESYELTQLGQQFVHYAMTDLPLKLHYAPEEAAKGHANAARTDAG
jgi:hypothetical protein